MELPIYKKSQNYSYTLGAYPSLELLQQEPSLVQQVLLHSSFLQRTAAEKIVELCRQHQIPFSVQDKIFRRLSPKENCFVIAQFRKSEKLLHPTCPHLVLHEPSDMGNLGSILRSSLGFNFLDVAIIQPAADVFDPKVVRGSIGAIFSLRIRRYESFSTYREEHPHHDCFPFMLDGATSLKEFKWPESASPALIFGSEGSGLPSEFSKIGRSLVIPHSDKIDSLNLAIAVSIGLYQADAVRDGISPPRRKESTL